MTRSLSEDIANLSMSETEGWPNVSLPVHERALVSDRLTTLVEYVVGVWLCSVVGYLGVIDNIITIIVFSKQGFQETINISMTNLAIWDLIQCFSNCIFRLYFPIGLLSPYIGAMWLDFTSTTVVYLSFFASCVSTSIAAYVAIERCLCVSKPFLVKQILTPKVTTIINVVLSLVVFGSLAVNFCQFSTIWTYSPTFNKTIMERVKSQHYSSDIEAYYNMISIVWPIASFLVICACTGLIFHYLRKAAVVRSKMGANSNGENSQATQVSLRDQQIIKMLLIILIIYIVTLVPRLARYTTKLVVPQFKYKGSYHNIYLILTRLMFFFGLINAAVNPFVFYYMSSRFRSTLLSIFRPQWIKKITRQ